MITANNAIWIAIEASFGGLMQLDIDERIVVLQQRYFDIIFRDRTHIKEYTYQHRLSKLENYANSIFYEPLPWILCRFSLILLQVIRMSFFNMWLSTMFLIFIIYWNSKFFYNNTIVFRMPIQFEIFSLPIFDFPIIESDIHLRPNISKLLFHVPNILYETWEEGQVAPLEKLQKRHRSSFPNVFNFQMDVLVLFPYFRHPSVVS